MEIEFDINLLPNIIIGVTIGLFVYKCSKELGGYMYKWLIKQWEKIKNRKKKDKC